MPGMGATTPTTELDKAYRSLVSEWLRAVMDRHEFNKQLLADAMQVDRATASRYVDGKVRAPLQQLTFLAQALPHERLPVEIEKAFWASKPSAKKAQRQTA